MPNICTSNAPLWTGLTLTTANKNHKHEPERKNFEMALERVSWSTRSKPGSRMICSDVGAQQSKKTFDTGSTISDRCSSPNVFAHQNSRPLAVATVSRFRRRRPPTNSLLQRMTHPCPERSKSPLSDAALDSGQTKLDAKSTIVGQTRLSCFVYPWA